MVKEEPALKSSPDAVLTSPPEGTESTLMESVSPVSGSVGAEIFSSVAAESSSSVTVEFAAATGERLLGEGLTTEPPPPPHALNVSEMRDGMTIFPFWLAFCN